jgi:hypothetical protein
MGDHMADRQLILTCTLSGPRDGAPVVKLLQQYGLQTSTVGTELVAQGDVPCVLGAMHGREIEAHLLGRIEDAAPGTRIAAIRATIVARARN